MRKLLRPLGSSNVRRRELFKPTPSISLPVIRHEPKRPRPFGSSNGSGVVRRRELFKPMPSISLPVIRQEPKHLRPFGSSNGSGVVSYSSPHPALASPCEPKPPSTIRVFQWVWRRELLKPTPKVGHNGHIRRLGSLHSQTHFIKNPVEGKLVQVQREERVNQQQQ
ncbi:hypothetical protein C8J57DRAFT_1227050 [Mycena rebaudengoi]|nr:hypothetical protein C8J57DRAFT_1227050 [Mycena rebaudengoi]